MTGRLTITCTLTAIVLMVGPTAQADLTYEMITDAGMPQVLVGGTGFNPGNLNVVTMGGTEYLVVADTTTYRHDVFSLTTDVSSRSDNNAPVSAQAGLFGSGTHAPGGYYSDLYKGTVRGAANSGDDTTYPGSAVGALGDDGLSGWTSAGTMFGLAYISGGTAALSEFRLEDTSGNLSVSAGTAARRVKSNVIADAGGLKTASTVFGSAGTDAYRFLTINGNNQAIRKLEIGAMSTPLPTNDYATRTVTSGGQLVDSTSALNLVANLVPTISDLVTAMAYNEANGYLYVLSTYTAGDDSKHVYLSALDVAWGDVLGNNSLAAYVDLDPNSGNTFLEITYDSGDADPDLLAAAGLAFNADGSTLYVSNSTKDDFGSGDRVFIFRMVPEPATMGLLGLGFAGMAVLRRRRRNAS